MLRSCNKGKQIGVVFSLKLMGESNKIKAMLFLRLVLLKSSWTITMSNFFFSKGSPCKMTIMGRSKELGNKDGGNNTLLKSIQTLRAGLTNQKMTYCSVGPMVDLVQKCFKDIFCFEPIQLQVPNFFFSKSLEFPTWNGLGIGISGTLDSKTEGNLNCFKQQSRAGRIIN